MDSEDNNIRSCKRRGRILVVDDQPLVARAVRAILVHEGFQVETASNGREALNLLLSDPRFDLIITDVRMPEMDGLELLRQSRQLRKDLPIIIMTAYTNRKNRQHAIEEGAFDYIPKPFGIKVLLKAVRDALKEK